MTGAERLRLWRQLQEAGLTAGEEPPPLEIATPWFTRMALGFAGWLGALFLLGFVAVGFGFVFRHGAIALVSGLLICGGAAAMLRLPDPTDFVGQFGLAASFAGQFLFLFGIYDSIRPGDVVMLLWVTLFEALLVIPICQPFHRTVCSFTAATAASLLLARLQLLSVVPGLLCLAVVLIWFHEFRWPHRGRLLRPVGYGLTLAALLINGGLYVPHLTGGLGHELFWRHRAPLWNWGGPLLLAVGLLVLVVLLLRREQIALREPAALFSLVGTFLLGGLAWQAPGLVIGTVLLLLGKSGGNRVLLGLGIVGLGGYLSSYYYWLQLSLLVKAGILVGSGLLLLAAWLVLHRAAAETEARHA